MAHRRVIVVGGDGLVGRAVVSKLRNLELDFRWTSRREGQGLTDGHRLDFDLESSEPAALIEWRPTHALLLAGVTSIRECELAPDRTRQVNVDASADLVKALSASDVRVTVASSSQVFGRDQFMPELMDARHATCEYGRQKVELEDQVLRLGGRVARCTKIMSQGSGVVASWVRSLRRGDSVEAFENMTVAPVTVDWAAAALLEIATTDQAQQVFHLSSRDEDSYFGAACSVADQLQVPRDRVRSKSASHDPLNGIILGPHAALGRPYSSLKCPAPTTAESIAEIVTLELKTSFG